MAFKFDLFVSDQVVPFTTTSSWRILSITTKGWRCSTTLRSSLENTVLNDVFFYVFSNLPRFQNMHLFHVTTETLLILPSQDVRRFQKTTKLQRSWCPILT